MSGDPFWKQLADTRHRVQMTKLHLRTDAAMAAVSGVDEVKFTENIDYADGTKALRFDDSGTGFIYYPSGNVAVCASRFSPYQMKYFFYGDDSKGTLIGFSSEKAEGFALSGTRKVLWNLDGGSIVGDDGVTIKRAWRWDPTKQNSGSPPTEPVVVYLNDCLTCTFTSRQDVNFKFSNLGVSREFDCCEKLRRYESYLQRSSRDDTGRVDVAMENPMTLQDRLAVQLEANKLQRAKLNPRSDMIANPAMSGVMKSLEDHFQPYEQRIKNEQSTAGPVAGEEALNQTYSSTSIGGDWLGEASKMTLSETDRIKALAASKVKSNQRSHTTGSIGRAEAGPGARAEGGGEPEKFYWQKKDGKLMNNIEVLEALLEQNPVLAQPKLVANASGRYLAGSTPPSTKPKMRKLRNLTHRTFDDVIKMNAKTGKVVFVAALRADIAACRKAELVLEMANYELYEQAAKAAGGAGGDPSGSGSGGAGSAAGGDGVEKRKEVEPNTIMCRFDMASSRLLIDRYNIQSAPCYLMFYAGQLVYGGTLGGAPILLSTGREPPHVMLVEPSTKDQLIIEKIMKKEQVRCDLALSMKDVQHHVALQRSVGLGKGMRKFHGVVILGDGLSESDVSSVISTYAGMQGTLFVSLCPRESVTLSQGAIYRIATNKKGSQSVKVSKQYRNNSRPASPSGGSAAKKKPLACLSTGVVFRPRSEHLRGGKTHIGVMKPFKPATLKYLITRWQCQDFHDPSKARGPEGDDHLAAEHMGLSVTSLLAKFKEVASEGRKGNFVADNATFGLSLSASESTVRGTVLKK